MAILNTRDVIQIPWGMWSPTGQWYPNPLLMMSKEQQLNENIASGYCCSHAYTPKRCSVCAQKGVG